MHKALYFYHGTHSGNIDSIMSGGLTPQAAPNSSMRGNLSTINGFTENRVFLAPCIEDAAYYAKSQAEKAKQDPVILMVCLQDPSLLSVSDDYINEKAIQAMLAVCELPPLEFDSDMDVHQYGTSSEAYYMWREIISVHHQDLMSAKPYQSIDLGTDFMGLLEDEDQIEIASKIWDAVGAAMREAGSHEWRLSIATDRDPSVGYCGEIKPGSLTRLDQKCVLDAVRKIRRGSGVAANWNLDAPIAASKPSVSRARRP